jgi:hypothetical protein
VGCLQWWGDIAAAVNDDALQDKWMCAVRDVAWVPGEAVKGVPVLYVHAVFK